MLKKFLIGTFALAILLGGAMAIVPKVVKAEAQAIVTVSDVQYAATVRQGSSGQAALIWQRFLNGYSTTAQLVEDGAFGPLSTVQAKAWQASRGLVADGVLGAMSRAAAIAQIQSGTPASAFPAGCTSTVGYSSVTGLPCSSVSTLPAGCSSTAGYSPTTGAKCDGGSSTGGTTVVLSGEGTVKSYSWGSAEESSVSENQSDVELVAIDVELENDGSLQLDRFDLYMGEANANSNSSKPWDYFTKATLMADGATIATMNVDSSSDWSESTNDDVDTTSQEYRLRFTGLSKVLASDETTTLSVAFDTVSNLDSADLTADWLFAVTATSFRFVDATGFVFTDGPTGMDDGAGGTFSIEAADHATLKLAAATSNPDTKIIGVNATSDTNGEVIGIFTIEETNDVDANITEMIVTLASATSETITDMVKKLYLYQGTTLVGQETVNAAAVTFDNIDLDVSADTKVTLTVKADFDDTNDAVRYQNGDTINVASVNLTKYTDQYGNDEGDTGMGESGAFVGNSHGLYAEGIAVTDFSSVKTVVTADNGNNTKLSYAISYKVTAFGDDFYLPKTIAITTLGTNGLMYTVYDETAGGVTTALAESVSSISSSADTVAGSGDEAGTSYFKVADGQTETFTATISLTTPGGLAGHYFHIQLGSVGYNVDTTTAADTLPFVLTPAQDFDTQADTLDA